ncbi:hypothetical protein [Polaromonas sp. A23]|nr:hypothetical protein [Polaromonas sp. A23]
MRFIPFPPGISSQDTGSGDAASLLASATSFAVFPETHPYVVIGFPAGH